MRRVVALLAPALARRSAAPAAGVIAQPSSVPGAWLRFSAAAEAPRRKPRDDGEWFNKPGLSVQELNDEIFRRFETRTPSKLALDSLLRRVQTADEAKLAAKAVERFHGQRCEAGWVTGLGPLTSNEFAKACTRAGATDVAVSMFAKAPLVGLTLAPEICCRVLAAAGSKDAETVLAAYNKLRDAGLPVNSEVARFVVKGLQGPGGGGSPKRALETALTFEQSGVSVGRRAWNALLCAATAAADLETVDGVVAAMAAAKQEPNATTHLAVACAALLKGDTPAAAEALRAAATLEDKAQAKEGPDGKPMSPKEISAEVVARWASRLVKGAATPGGVQGLAARLREALDASGSALPLDVQSIFKDAQLEDGPAAPPAAAP